VAVVLARPAEPLDGHLVDVLPWMSREWAMVLAIALLGYFTLFNRPTKRLLVRVLATIKPPDIR
jgi:hypothetical protein